jgi:hypothetical protein
VSTPNNMSELRPLQDLVDVPPKDGGIWYGVYVDAENRSGYVESLYNLRIMVRWERIPTTEDVEVFRDMVSVFLGRELEWKRG